MTRGEHAAAAALPVLALVAVFGPFILPADRALFLGSAASACALGAGLFIGWREARGSVVGAIVLTVASFAAFAAYTLAAYQLPGWQAGHWPLLLAGAVAIVGSSLVVAVSRLSRFAKVGVALASVMSFFFFSMSASLTIACAHGNCF